MASSVFLDTDVIIDFLVDREPFSTAAAKIFDLASSGELEVHTSALCIHNVHYFVRKMLGANKALKVIKDLLEIIEVESTGKQEIVAALESGFSDFEDAIQNFTAEREGIKTILTRNLKDFRKSNLHILTPSEFLKSHKFN